MVSKVRGTRDIIEGQSMQTLRHLLEQHLNTYRYTPIYLPLIEDVDLFKRSLGQETDVVSKEMFVVTSSSGQADERICLRPEATASTVRAFIENGIQETPWKVFTIGEMFRYERPQKGRFRQFYQCNVENIGSEGAAEDALFISMLNSFFAQACGLVEYALHLNYLGCQADRESLKKDIYTFLEKHEQTICQTCQKRKEANILRVFDCKNETCHNLYLNAPRILDHLCSSCANEWSDLQKYLQSMSVSFTIVPHLVRGLDYYNKTVFEFVSPLLGAQSAFCGGGRYDSLVTLLGGKEDKPSIGAAVGLDRLLMIYEVLNKQWQSAQKPLYLVLPLSPAEYVVALHVADFLHQKNVCADVLFEKSIKHQMKKANKLGAKTCFIVGSEEVATGSVTVKDMVTGKEVKIQQTEIDKYL